MNAPRSSIAQLFNSLSVSTLGMHFVANSLYQGTVRRLGFETAWTSSSRTLNLAMRQGGKSLLISK